MNAIAMDKPDGNDLAALAEMIEAVSSGRPVDPHRIQMLAAALARREPDLRGALTLICNHMAKNN